MDSVINRSDIYHGVWPVMLTPFDEKREIDWASLEKLIDWYIAAGVGAVCQLPVKRDVFPLRCRVPAINAFCH